ncbi:MAG TPA: helix-turn-helix domain-containing protein [Candidatus Dormibacteraeota bacterium]
MDESTFRRDADRSRLAILDAAEALFADHGFEAVSMERIGRAANLSRGAPGYFFGSKDALYRAVMERLFETTEQLVERTHRELADVPGHDLDRTLEIVVDNLMEFLYERPTFVTLVEREALRRSGVMQGNRVHLTLLRMALTLTDRMDWTSAASNPQQLLLTLLSLCWFPLANPPLIRDLGGQLDRTFVEARKRHVVALLRTGLIGGRRR